MVDLIFVRLVVPKVEVKPKKAKRDPTAMPKKPEETSQVSTRSTDILDTTSISRLIPITLSHEQGANYGAPLTNPPSISVSLQ